MYIVSCDREKRSQSSKFTESSMSINQTERKNCSNRYDVIINRLRGAKINEIDDSRGEIWLRIFLHRATIDDDNDDDGGN